jgi:hypothetical protein
MVTSQTYRQSSVRRPEAEKADPENRLFARMNVRRLQGEAIRDAMLQVCGQLNTAMTGPGVFPKLPEELGPVPGWKTSTEPGAQDRRSVYVCVKRNLRYSFFDTFDAPDSNESCSRRNVTTSAPQALTLMNGEFTAVAAKVFAGRVLQTKSVRPEHIIDRIYELAFGRSPDEQELRFASEYLRDETETARKRLRSGMPIALPSVLPESTDLAHAGAVVELCHVVLNLNEFLYVD